MAGLTLTGAISVPAISTVSWSVLPQVDNLIDPTKAHFVTTWHNTAAHRLHRIAMSSETDDSLKSRSRLINGRYWEQDGTDREITIGPKGSSVHKICCTHCDSHNTTDVNGQRVPRCVAGRLGYGETCYKCVEFGLVCIHKLKRNGGTPAHKALAKYREEGLDINLDSLPKDGHLLTRLPPSVKEQARYQRRKKAVQNDASSGSQDTAKTRPPGQRHGHKHSTHRDSPTTRKSDSRPLEQRGGVTKSTTNTTGRASASRHGQRSSNEAPGQDEVEQLARLSLQEGSRAGGKSNVGNLEPLYQGMASHYGDLSGASRPPGFGARLTSTAYSVPDSNANPLSHDSHRQGGRSMAADYEVGISSGGLASSQIQRQNLSSGLALSGNTPMSSTGTPRQGKHYSNAATPQGQVNEYPIYGGHGPSMPTPSSMMDQGQAMHPFGMTADFDLMSQIDASSGYGWPGPTPYGMEDQQQPMHAFNPAPTQRVLDSTHQGYDGNVTDASSSSQTFGQHMAMHSFNAAPPSQLNQYPDYGSGMTDTVGILTGDSRFPTVDIWQNPATRTLADGSSSIPPSGDQSTTDDNNFGPGFLDSQGWPSGGSYYSF